jgi:Shedu protein SduA, C-terminal/Shedu protein SduA, N-terminal
MGNDDIIRMVSTSASSADVSDVVLRETSRRRLVFRATLVRNPRNAEASVRGLLVYQAKRGRDGWVDVDSLKLTNLKAGEWTKVELSSEEILRLYQAVASLYSYMRERGISYGEQELVPITKGEVVRRVLALLEGDDTQELVETFLDWASNQDTRTLATSLGATSADTLITFGAAVTAARMRRFIDVARRGLRISEESKWQSLLKQESWVISQLYAQPVVLIKDQAYVGGKSIENTGGSVIDYLFANNLTGNVLLVEIKTPTAPLLRDYRGNVMAPAADLSGGVQQLLQARHSFEEEYRQLIERSSVGLQVVSPRCLLIVGTLSSLSDQVARRSFEIFRNNNRQVEVVTFDELIAKAEQLVSLLEGQS